MASGAQEYNNRGVLMTGSTYRRFIKMDKLSDKRSRELKKSFGSKPASFGVKDYSWIATTANGSDNTNRLPTSGYCKKITAVSVIVDGRQEYTDVVGHESPNGVLYAEAGALSVARRRSSD